MRTVGGLAMALLALSCSGKTLLVGSNEMPLEREAGAPSSEGGAPSFGEPERIVSSDLTDAPARMVSDGKDLYWVTFTGGGVWTVPVSGGTPTPLKDTTDATPKIVYVDDTDVYYLSKGGIVAVPKRGGGAQLAIAATRVLAASIVDGIAYWVSESAPSSGSPVPNVSLSSAPLTTGAAKTLAALGSPTYTEIAVTGHDVVVGDATELAAVPVGSGALRTINKSLECSELLGISNGVFCAQSLLLGNPPLVFVPTHGRPSNVVAMTNNARSMATDTSSLYWVDDAPGGGVEAVPLHGGKPVLVVKDVHSTTLAVDAAHVFWNESDGTIWRATKSS